MGNSPSISDAEDEHNSKEIEDGTSDNEEENDRDGCQADISGLFDHANLRVLAGKVKEEITENVIQQYRYQILRWLEDRENKNEENTVTISSFCDWLMAKGVSKDEAVQAFQQFDVDGSGEVEVENMQTTLKSMNGTSMSGELGRSIRMLQSCTLVPGFVDVFSGDKEVVKHHAQRILKYLLRNRSPSMSMPFPYLNGFNNAATMRNTVLKSVFKNLKECGQTGSQGLPGATEMRTISPCHSSIELSSNANEVHRLTNGDANTFWQSDGSARSHWIRLYIKPNVVLKSLSITVDSSDSSYMPELVAICGGRSCRTLLQIKETRIPSHVTGDFVLLKNAKVHYPIIQINIRKCRNDGCDTRVHGIKTVGYKLVKEQGVTVADAAASWYLQVLATTVTMTMPIVPQLQDQVSQQTRKALTHIPPLSLSSSSQERPSFLSKNVLQEVEQFMSKIATQDEQISVDGFEMLLTFNLARGNVGGLLKTLKHMQEHPEMVLSCTKLLQNTFSVRDACRQKTGYLLQMSLSGCDGGQADENSSPENVLNAVWNPPSSTALYLSEEGKTKVNMVFKSSEFIQLTKIRIKVATGARGVKRGLVFVYRDSEEFDLVKHTERFSKYDTWQKMEYDFSCQVREAGIAGSPENPVCYFTFDEDCDEMEVPVSWSPVGHYVLIKFLEPRAETATKIGVVGVKFYGFVRKPVLVEEEIKVKHPLNPKKKPTCTCVEVIQYILQFLVDLSQDQTSKKNLTSGKAEFLEFSEVQLDTIWELYNSFRKRGDVRSDLTVARGDVRWDQCAMLILQLLYCLLPILSTNNSDAPDKKELAEALFHHLCGLIDEADPDSNQILYKLAQQLLIDDVGCLAAKAIEACKLLKKQSLDKLECIMKEADVSLLGTLLRQSVVILTHVCESISSVSRVEIVRTFQPLSEELNSLATLLPTLFPKITSEHWNHVQTEDIVLRTWEVESSHNYENNQHNNQMFSCPGAEKFVVDFDLRCETERRYDYLIFTDAKGTHMRFDQKVGNPKWPKQVTFCGPHLVFLFHSDSSNTEWGYKFKVTARGSPDTPLPWCFDLQLSLTKMLGRMCGAVLSDNPHVSRELSVTAEETAEQEVLKSDLWTSLFRGGFTIRRLEHSLSGKLMAEESSSVILFLWDMINGKEGLPAILLSKCKESYRGMTAGGPSVDEAVVSVFAALAWHTQQLREEIKKIVDLGSVETVSDGLVSAYLSAEQLRLTLVNLRQKAVVEDEGKLSARTEDPVEVCKKKAQFLMRFAGLTKVQLRNEHHQSKLKKKMATKKHNNVYKTPDVSDKYPSFKLILEFVQDPAWTTDMVTRILQERSQHARMVADVYTFMADFIQAHVENDSKLFFQIPVVLLLQEVLHYQNGFTWHYANCLDGCGLQLEARVRQSYYRMIRLLTEPFNNVHRHQIDKQYVPAYDYIQVSVLHLLDIEWQPYDLQFITDVKLPALYMSIAKETVKMRDCTLGANEEDKEMEVYTQCMKWFKECESGFEAWYNKNDGGEEGKSHKKEVQMFVARFCDLLDVEVTCDGCGVTLPGRRYRCLQCTDMDLCATCYAGGVKPEGDHSDDHDMVHLVYKCNKCQAFIVGTRFHCNDCDDFDLCFGCRQEGNFPPEHSDAHDVTMCPMVKLRPSQDSDSLLQAYIHQHVWLLFTILGLSAGDITHAGPTTGALDSDYYKLAAGVQNQCIEIVTHCLQQVPDDAEDSTKVIMMEGQRSIEEAQEEAFAIHTQERIMGLLGAMIPEDPQCPHIGVTYNFSDEAFIQLLFRIAKGESGHEVNTRHLSMGLLGPLLAKCHAKTADMSVKIDENPDKDSSMDGKATIQYLFRFGADCLMNCGLEHACSVVRILQNLYTSPDWRAVIEDYLTSSVLELSAHVDLTSIFALFVLAGFPEVLTIGKLVEYSVCDMDKKRGVVLKHFPDKDQTLVIDVKTRKRHTVPDNNVDCISLVTETWDTGHVTLFINSVQDIVDKIRNESSVTVEMVWVLSLSLKVLNNLVKSHTDSLMEELFEPGFVQGLVFIASKGTEFSQQWFIKDLEVLSLMLYTHEGAPSPHKTRSKDMSYPQQLAVAMEKHAKVKASTSKEFFFHEPPPVPPRSGSASAMFDTLPPPVPPRKANISPSSENIFASLDSDATSSPELDDYEDDEEEPDFDDSNLEDNVSSLLELFPDIDKKTRTMFENLHTDLKLPYTVLKVIYEMNDKNPNDVVKAIVDNLHSSAKEDDIKRLSLKWEAIANGKSASEVIPVTDKVIDTGIHFHPSMSQTNRKIDKATEDKKESDKLMPDPDNEFEADVQNKMRKRSKELLKNALEKHSKANNSEYLLKVNMAMSVLYARQVLTSLLAHWPDSGHVITEELLGCQNVKQIPCVIDLLNKMANKDDFQKMVDKVIKHCDADSLVQIASTAAQFMEEVTMSSVTCQSAHPMKTVEQKSKPFSVQHPGASYLDVNFDPRCALKADNVTLIISSSKDLTANKHELTGTNPSKWHEFRIPGDTLYYKVEVYPENEALDQPTWGYKFTVTAGSRDSFDTGYAILSNVLSTDLARSLPLKELWEILVYVATKQTGIQRLKSIRLLLKLTQTQHRSPSMKVLTLDLSLLRPLWLLYTHMTKTEPKNAVVLPPSARALTELFLCVETLAMEWDVMTEYLVAMHDIDDIKKAIIQGMVNVAAVSTMIGYNNVSLEIIPALKKKKAESSAVPPS